MQTPIQRSGTSPRIPFQTSPSQINECRIEKFDVALAVRSIPVPDQTEYLAHTHPVWLVRISKSQSSFQTLRIKCAIQTLRIRQHMNVHAGHVVLISSLVFLYKTCWRRLRFFERFSASRNWPSLTTPHCLWHLESLPKGSWDGASYMVVA